MSSEDREKSYGTIIAYDQKMRTASDTKEYVYRSKVRYTTKTGNTIISLSKNTIHSPTDYCISQVIEISYCLKNPKSFYICNDMNRKVLHRLILFFGVALCNRNIFCIIT